MLTRIQKIEFPSLSAIRNPKTGRDVERQSVEFLTLVQNKWCDPYGNLLKIPQPRQKTFARDPLSLDTFKIASPKHQELFLNGLVDGWGNFVRPQQRAEAKRKAYMNAYGQRTIYITAFPDMQVYSIYDTLQDIGVLRHRSHLKEYKLAIHNIDQPEYRRQLMIHNIDQPDQQSHVLYFIQLVLQKQLPPNICALMLKAVDLVRSNIQAIRQDIALHLPRALVSMVELYIYQGKQE